MKFPNWTLFNEFVFKIPVPVVSLFLSVSLSNSLPNSLSVIFGSLDQQQWNNRLLFQRDPLRSARPLFVPRSSLYSFLFPLIFPIFPFLRSSFCNGQHASDWTAERRRSRYFKWESEWILLFRHRISSFSQTPPILLINANYVLSKISAFSK